MSAPGPRLTLNELLGRLEGVGRSGSNHVARCPAHEDSKPSLSVSEGEDGRFLLCCRAGCSFESICRALVIEPRQLFPEGVAPKSNGVHRAKAKPAPKPLSDEQVEAMVEALRQDSSAQKHVLEVLKFSSEVVAELRLGLYVDTSGRRWLAYPYQRAGLWTYANCRSLDGERTFRRFPAGQKTQLYRAQTLEEGGTAILVEGERDAAAALTLGVRAEVGGSSGAAVVSMPGVEQVEIAAMALASQRLVYLATDNDPAGDKAAEKLAARLGSQRCRRVRLQGFKDLGDLLSELSVEKARTSALQALKVAEAVAPEKQLQRIAAREFIASASSEAPIDWLMDDLVPSRGGVLITGVPGAGKTWFSLTIASQALRQGRGAILFEEEGDRKALAGRLENLRLGVDGMFVVFRSGLKLVDVEGLAIVLDNIRDLERPAIILDPLVSLSGADENDTAAAVQCLSALSTIQRECPQALLLVLHHPSKSGAKGESGSKVYSSRGSSVFPGWADAQYEVRDSKNQGGRLRFVVEPTKMRGAALPDPQEISIELGTGEVTCKPQLDADLARKKEEIFNAVAGSEEPLSKRTIEGSVRCRGQVLRRLVDELVAEGRLVQSASGGYSTVDPSSGARPFYRDGTHPSEGSGTQLDARDAKRSKHHWTEATEQAEES